MGCLPSIKKNQWRIGTFSLWFRSIGWLCGSLRDTHWQGKLLELFNSLRKPSKEFPQSFSLSFNPKLYAAAKKKSGSGQGGNGEKKVRAALSCMFLRPSATSIITLIANMFLAKKWAMNESLCSRELQLPQSKWGFSTTLLYFTPNREENTKEGRQVPFQNFYTLKSLIKLSSCSFPFHHKISAQVINFKKNKVGKAMPFADSSQVAAPFNTFERTPGTKERRESRECCQIRYADVCG